MTISQLQIHNIRNLRQVSLPQLSNINVFFGANGSGKTSILEAIHLLGMARSFRSGNTRTLVSHGEDQCTVYGVSTRDGRPGGIPLAIQRSLNGSVLIKVGGQAVRTAAELVEYLPLQLLDATSFELLSGSPGARRQFLNWGVFHVEQRFFPGWQRFQRCIKQRNKVLRHGKLGDAELAVWTRELALAGEEIHQYRLKYFESLAPVIREIMRRLAPSLGGLEVRYRKGWDKALPYNDALAASNQADQEQGYTHVGPQRADIKVTIGGFPAADTLSRGQQKLVICALKLAQGQLMTDQQRRSCTYLVDDLPSELDALHCRLVCEVLAEMGSQVFITCVARTDLDTMWPEEVKTSLFHVEQGRIDKVAG